ncbi:MAG TPA: CBS domain-containing protein [Polyangiaceae bacterium]|nr:CBS domain-containing protein [Polyangiaceae bacterium]
MSSQVLSCAPEDSLNRAAQIMWEQDCGCLPVVDAEGEVVGIITDRDICMAAYTQGIALQGASVGSAMSHPVVGCRTEDSIAHVEQLMKERQLRRIPVLNDLNCLAGMITVADLARSAELQGLRGAVSAPGIAHTLAGICKPREHAAAAA